MLHRISLSVFTPMDSSVLSAAGKGSGEETECWGCRLDVELKPGLTVGPQTCPQPSGPHVAPYKRRAGHSGPRIARIGFGRLGRRELQPWGRQQARTYRPAGTKTVTSILQIQKLESGRERERTPSSRDCPRVLTHCRPPGPSCRGAARRQGAGESPRPLLATRAALARSLSC